MSETTAVAGSGRWIKLPGSYTGPLLISAILLAAHFSFGILDSYQKLLLAITACFFTEAFLHRLQAGGWRNMSSAYISGISVGILVRSPFYWPFALCGMISIASKYVLRYKGRHIWNPTNFGVVAIILLASDSTAILSIQWGSNMWAMGMIWTIGFVTIYKINRFNICGVYIVSFSLFAWIRSMITGDPFLAEMAPVTGPMYQLFVLFMITDPKTTVSSRSGQNFVAFLIAAVEFLFRLHNAVYAPFYALFIVGPMALVIEDWYRSRRGSYNHGNSRKFRESSES